MDIDIFLESDHILSKYGILPRTVNQNNIITCIENNIIPNFISKIENYDDVAGRGPSRKSIMSICSYMNTYTIAAILYLFHSIGSGKTRKVLLAALNYNRDICIILLHNTQRIPFWNELTKGGVLAKIFPFFTGKIDVITCKSIVDNIDKDEKRIDYLLADKVVILDETHHIKSVGYNEETNGNQFNAVKRALSNRKIITRFQLSATPIIDNSSERYGIAQLFGYNVQATNVNDSNIYKPYMSYLKENFIKTNITEIQCRMREGSPQHQAYVRNACNKKGIYVEVSSISRVFIPTDTDNGVEYYNSEEILEDPTDMFLDSKYSISHKVKADITNNQLEKIAEDLEGYAIKYHVLLYIIINGNRKPVYIYDSWIERGGVDMLTKILTRMGFIIAQSVADMKDRNLGRKIFAPYLLGDNVDLITEMFSWFNSPDNDGSICEIVLLTPKYSENISIITAATAFIILYPWNKGSFDQIRGRITRKNTLYFLPEAERVLNIGVLILEYPNGGETIDHIIKQRAALKYKEVKPVLKCFAENNIEKLYSEDNIIYPFRYNNFRKSRLNMSIRHCSKPILFRDINIKISVDIMKLIPSNYISIPFAEDNKNYISSIIPKLEELMILNYKRELDDKYMSILLNMSSMFFLNPDDNQFYNILYNINNSTTDYQRFGEEDSRCLRKLNYDKLLWEDCLNKDLLNEYLEQYKNRLINFEEGILDKWKRIGYYAVIYLLHRCCRLVKYNHSEMIFRKNASVKDTRKINRGMNWKSIDVSILWIACKNLDILSRGGDEVIVFEGKINKRALNLNIKKRDIMALLLNYLKSNDMLIVLPA